ncbi:MAG: hypothetical protein IJU66_05230 [Oscillospiraceae bacterium]|nr:hypothetical protein [Oscillospiraceae bacterium]
MTMGRLCRRIFLPAGLALLCVFFAFLAGRTAESALSDGVEFSGVVLAVTSGEGDRVPELLETYLGKMSDVRAYCRVEAMEQGAALDALDARRVTAVLILPEDFIHRVQYGDNPDVRLVVDAHRPLGALLTLWIGQSLCDLLASVQCGIYTVLRSDAAPGGAEAERVLTEINLRYIQWVLNRRDLFVEREVLPTARVPIALHYELSILWFLLLALTPAFSWLYQGSWLSYHRRLRPVCPSAWTGCWATLAACVPVMWLLSFAALALLLREDVPALLPAALPCAMFFASYAALCALVSGSAAMCGTLSFCLDTVFLVLAGGVVPPALLPPPLQGLCSASPITWLLSASARTDDAPRAALCLAASSAVLGLICVPLYLRRCAREAEG